jgi:hypothetical protein
VNGYKLRLGLPADASQSSPRRPGLPRPPANEGRPIISWGLLTEAAPLPGYHQVALFSSLMGIEFEHRRTATCVR